MKDGKEKCVEPARVLSIYQSLFSIRGIFHSFEQDSERDFYANEGERSTTVSVENANPNVQTKQRKIL